MLPFPSLRGFSRCDENSQQKLEDFSIEAVASISVSISSSRRPRLEVSNTCLVRLCFEEHRGGKSKYTKSNYRVDFQSSEARKLTVNSPFPREDNPELVLTSWRKPCPRTAHAMKTSQVHSFVAGQKPLALSFSFSFSLVSCNR